MRPSFRLQLALSAHRRPAYPGILVSHRVHSYYTRSPADLPGSAQSVQPVLHVRCFRFQNRQCQRQTLVERVLAALPVQALRTTR